MSEIGSSKGQNEDKNGPVFDSSKLSEKQTTEHFTNVEGAEERAKAAEKAKKEAEKEAEEVHEKDVRAAAKKVESGEKKGIGYYLFAGWHKWVTIVAVLTLLILSVAIVIYVRNNENDKNLSYRDKAENYFVQQREAVDVSEDIEGYISAREAYKDRYNNAMNAHEKFYEGYYYSLFVYYEGINVRDALNAFDGIQIPEDYTTEEACDLKNAAKLFYEKNDFSNNEELEAVIKDCKSDEEVQ